MLHACTYYNPFSYIADNRRRKKKYLAREKHILLLLHVPNINRCHFFRAQMQKGGKLVRVLYSSSSSIK